MSDERRFYSPDDAFRWLKLPGMERQPVFDQPLQNRCECGRAISANKACCRACRQAEIRRMAAQIHTAAELDQFLSHFGPAMQYDLLKEMQPYIVLIPETEALKSETEPQAA